MKNPTTGRGVYGLRYELKANACAIFGRSKSAAVTVCSTGTYAPVHLQWIYCRFFFWKRIHDKRRMCTLISANF